MNVTSRSGERLPVSQWFTLSPFHREVYSRLKSTFHICVASAVFSSASGLARRAICQWQALQHTVRLDAASIPQLTAVLQGMLPPRPRLRLRCWTARRLCWSSSWPRHPGAAPLFWVRRRQSGTPMNRENIIMYVGTTWKVYVLWMHVWLYIRSILRVRKNYAQICKTAWPLVMFGHLYFIYAKYARKNWPSKLKISLKLVCMVWFQNLDDMLCSFLIINRLKGNVAPWFNSRLWWFLGLSMLRIMDFALWLLKYWQA